jgi:heptosyltransferase-2
MRILACVLSGLGDAVLFSPTLAAIKEGLPDCELHTLSALKATGEYVAGLPFVDRSETYDFLSVSHLDKLAKLMEYRRRSYDVIVLPYPAARWQYHAGALAIGAGRLVAHEYSRWQRRSGLYSYLAPVHNMHEVDLNAGLLAGLGLSAVVRRRAHVNPNWVLPRTRLNTIAFHMMSLESKISKGNYRKAWPYQNWLLLASRLHGRGFEIAAVAAGAELSLVDHLEQDCGFAIERITGTLCETARALSQVRTLIANDSGIAHLGAALGVPTLALFGMTDPEHLSPIGTVECLRASACPPCFKPSHRVFSCVKNLNFACITRDIGTSLVESALERVLRRDEVLAPQLL